MKNACTTCKPLNLVILIITQVVLTVLISSAQQINFKGVGITTKHYLDSINIEENKGKLILPVEINGVSYRFIFDTGSPTCISQKLFETLSPQILSKVKTKDQSGLVDNLLLVELKKINIGHIEFEQIPSLIIKPGNQVFECLKVDGIIGSNMFNQSIISINKSVHKLIVTDNEKNLNLKSKKNYMLPLIINPVELTPFIVVPFDSSRKVNELVIFDTGSDALLDLSIEHFRNMKKAGVVFSNEISARGSNSLGLYGVAKDTEQYRMTIEQLTLGEFKITNINAQTTLNRQSILGSEMLNYGNVTIDFKHRKFYFDPTVKEDKLNLTATQFDVSPLFKNKLVVGMVWKRNDIYNINPGDEITQINGVSLANKEVCELFTYAQLFKTEKTLDVIVRKDNGELKMINLKK